MSCVVQWWDVFVKGMHFSSKMHIYLIITYFSEVMVKQSICLQQFNATKINGSFFLFQSDVVVAQVYFNLNLDLFG